MVELRFGVVGDQRFASVVQVDLGCLVNDLGRKVAHILIPNGVSLRKCMLYLARSPGDDGTRLHTDAVILVQMNSEELRRLRLKRMAAVEPLTAYFEAEDASAPRAFLLHWQEEHEP